MKLRDYKKKKMIRKTKKFPNLKRMNRSINNINFANIFIIFIL